nr:hypothetical protein [Tanacetum cinerariifolium]
MKIREIAKVGDGGGRVIGEEKETSAVWKDGSAASEHVSFPEPLRAMGPTGPATDNPSEATAETAKSREDQSLHIPAHDSANRYAIISYIVALPLKKQPLLPGFPYEVLTLMKGSHPETKLIMCPSGPSARDVAWIPLCGVANSWAWFNLGRGALAQTDILERFENLQADYDQLVETHSKYGEMVKKLVQARSDLEHNANLYISMADRYKMVKNQALRIKELKDGLARKNSALVYAERINAERAQEKYKLSHEYKQSLSEPFNLAIQARWAKGLVEERSEEDLSAVMNRMEGFDAYADKKMFVEYDKLFEKRYPFFEKISCSFRHTVSDLLKVYPNFPPSERAPPSRPSFVKAPSSSAPNKP